MRVIAILLTLFTLGAASYEIGERIGTRDTTALADAKLARARALYDKANARALDWQRRALRAEVAVTGCLEPLGTQ